MSHTSNELPIPSPALSDSKGLEIARIWAAHGRQYVTIRTEIWNDPAAWGIMLVDFAKHVANAYSERVNLDRHQVLERIKAGFDAEWIAPTGEPSSV